MTADNYNFEPASAEFAEKYSLAEGTVLAVMAACTSRMDDPTYKEHSSQLSATLDRYAEKLTEIRDYDVTGLSETISEGTKKLAELRSLE